MEDTFAIIHDDESLENTFRESSILLSKKDFPYSFDLFPINWLMNRIEHVLEVQSPGPVQFPEQDAESPLGKIIAEHNFSVEDCVLLCLALTAAFAPESLYLLAEQANEGEHCMNVGGYFFRGSPVFSPTVRTAVFLLAGKDFTLRAKYAAYFHNKQKIFSSGLVQTEPQSPLSVFLDHQLVFSDQFLGTILQGEAPRLDADAGFPVRRGKGKHLLADVIMKEKTQVQISKLRTFAKNMQKLWELDKEEKVRSNFITIFSGEPGTGKSHAAEAIGNEFGLPVYKVNFAQMVSKYIGETEKNLEKVFDRFDKQPSILFFDEAESIFSRRTEVGSSNDQHANNLQSYLLQKVEEFSGIIILATNVQNLTHYFDRAFQRRFRLIVEFDFPDYPERLEIWKRSLFHPFVFEEGLTEKLAKNYQFSGGSIYNVASDAVIEALDQNTEVITFEMLENALKDEFKKTSRKYEMCTDEMVASNPARRHGHGFELRKNF
ncbi:MAG: ATP-binding protein [Flavobacteriales bacterium]|nr:ATP-binding protein [Flavobacteriales bacterium]